MNRIYYLFVSIVCKNTVVFGGFTHSKNFGDRLNLILLKLMTGRTGIPKRYVFPGLYVAKEKYLFIGSLVGEADSNTIIYGAGSISITDIPKVQPKKILAVRGPLTRSLLINNGFDCPEVYGDPALLMPRYYFPLVAKRHKVGIIPHIVDIDNEHVNWLMQQGAFFIDVRIQHSNYKKFINQVLSCEVILSSSLHGLIIADTYQLKSLWFKCSDEVIGNDFKFYDYYASIGLTKNNIQAIDFRIEKLNLTECFEKANLKELKIDLGLFLEQNPWC